MIRSLQETWFIVVPVVKKYTELIQTARRDKEHEWSSSPKILYQGVWWDTWGNPINWRSYLWFDFKWQPWFQASLEGKMYQMRFWFFYLSGKISWIRKLYPKEIKNWATPMRLPGIILVHEKLITTLSKETTGPIPMNSGISPIELTLCVIFWKKCMATKTQNKELL